jgi:hypothetical protein
VKKSMCFRRLVIEFMRAEDYGSDLIYYLKISHPIVSFSEVGEYFSYTFTGGVTNE